MAMTPPCTPKIQFHIQLQLPAARAPGVVMVHPSLQAFLLQEIPIPDLSTTQNWTTKATQITLPKNTLLGCGVMPPLAFKHHTLPSSWARFSCQGGQDETFEGREVHKPPKQALAVVILY